jgi:hypothetical protein
MEGTKLHHKQAKVWHEAYCSDEVNRGLVPYLKCTWGLKQGHRMSLITCTKSAVEWKRTGCTRGTLNGRIK